MYDLNDPPLHAPLRDHAAVLSATLFAVAHRSLERWPVEQPLINGRRQPSPAEVFAAGVGLFRSTDDRERALARLPATFSMEVRELLPAALAAWAEVRRSKASASA